MIYIYDLIFVIILLVIKDGGFWVLRKQPDIYLKVRKYYMWFEFSYIMLAVYFVPKHTVTEAMVAFFLSLTTKLFHDYLRKNIKQ